MNNEQYLLICLAEEAAEVAQAAAKCLRFGMVMRNPENRVSNIDHLILELNQLKAVEGLMKANNVLPTNPYADSETIASKLEAILKYGNISKDLGILV